MNGGARAAVGIVLGALALGVGALEPRTFDDPVLAERYRGLTEELRCLVCQNQNIADSNAGLARDLREQVETMLRDGQEDEAIVAYMVERYGEFVLYRPRWSAQNLALWLGPFALAALGLWLLYRQVRRRGQRAEPERAGMSDAERARVEALLASETGPDDGARPEGRP